MALNFIFRRTLGHAALLGLMVVGRAAQALDESDAGEDAASVASAEVIVTTSRVSLLGTAATASQGSVTEQELDLRPPTGWVSCWRACRGWL